MNRPFTRSEKLFMWRCARMYQYWSFLSALAEKRGKPCLAWNRWQRAQEWWERGWECSIGM